MSYFPKKVFEEYYDDYVWIPHNPQYKDEVKKSRKIIDLSDSNRREIDEAIYAYTNLKVGNFLIIISRYHQNINDEILMDVSIWEEKEFTPSGNQQKMVYHFNFFRDKRFENQPWHSFFNIQGEAINIPIKTLIEIIRFLQLMFKLPSLI